MLCALALESMRPAGMVVVLFERRVLRRFKRFLLLLFSIALAVRAATAASDERRIWCENDIMADAGADDNSDDDGGGGGSGSGSGDGSADNGGSVWCS